MTLHASKKRDPHEEQYNGATNQGFMNKEEVSPIAQQKLNITI